MAIAFPSSSPFGRWHTCVSALCLEAFGYLWIHLGFISPWCHFRASWGRGDRGSKKTGNCRKRTALSLGGAVGGSDADFVFKRIYPCPQLVDFLGVFEAGDLLLEFVLR